MFLSFSSILQGSSFVRGQIQRSRLKVKENLFLRILILVKYLIIRTGETLNFFIFCTKVWKHCVFSNDFSAITHWTHPRRFAIDSTSKFHEEISSKLHRFWKVNPRGNYDIDSTWKFRRGFDFQNQRNIDEFSTWTFRCCFDVEST